MASIYETLRLSIPHKSIRVLDIPQEDASDEIPGILHGNLRVVNLIDKPAFTALSYVWGTYRSPPHTMSVNSSSVAITPNCWLALRRLRRKFAPLTIWVDSICINQDDRREKETQIPLMDDIYSSATSVYIWLGDGSPEVESALHYISIAGFQQHLTNSNGVKYEIPRHWWPLWKIGFILATKNARNFATRTWEDGLLAGMDAYWSGGRTTPDSCVHFDSLEGFFSTNWARRVWTLQEIILAKKPIICYGNKSISWLSVVHTIAYLEYVVDQYNRLKFPASSFLVWKSMVLLWLYVNSDKEVDTWNQDSSSIAVRSFFPEHQAFFDACTRKHRLIANMTLGANIVFMISIMLVIRITLSSWPWAEQIIGLVYTGWALTFIVILLLDPVYQTTYYRSHSDSVLSSSIPEAIIHEICARRATDPRDKSFGIQAISSRLGIRLSPVDYGITQEDVHRELFVSLLTWSKSLGLLLCSTASGNNYESSWVPDFSENITDGWFHPAYLFQSAIYNATPSSLPIWTVRGKCLVLKGIFISSILKLSPPFKEITEEDISSRYENALLMEQLVILREYCDRHNPFVTKFIAQSLGDPNDPRGYLVHELTAFNVVQWPLLMNPLAKHGRLLFKTSIPGRMSAGTCPRESQIGDLIALVSGISLPLVLREWDDGYRFIGLAEIDGIMKGELWKNVIEEDLNEIIIR
ncbi:Heterokaryon incompatibility protein [Rutstroemia sp. NJR-2017a BBW]|nr:Heterokaryon incompatibility protein [Rutstroemia sp. NJR-2017a BBW]